MIILSILFGLALLFVGADGLVRGSSGLALKFGVQPLLVGLTVVAFGTSAPEMTVSLLAGLKGHGDVAIGNVVGSNIFNIAFILGLTALILPLKIHLGLIRRDIPILILSATTILPIIAWGGTNRAAGFVLTAALGLYTVATAIWLRRETPAAREEVSAPCPSAKQWAADIALLAAGLGMLVLGSDMLVSGAITLARHAGLSEAVIGLTLVAAGTSLPELATSVMAAIKGETDLAVGNIVGSNIFNSLGILGVTSLVSPLKNPGIALSDALVMIGLSLLLLPLAFTGRVLSRREGALFLALYAGYLCWLWPR